MGVILDGVFSHTGADSIYFNKYNRYDSVGAYNSTQSPYYPWYTFINYPDTYESWWGIDTLPNVNENNRQYTDYICGEGGVLDYWFYMGASGFRLDVADELPDEFLDNLRTAVKRNGSDKLLIGEVWEDASNKESYGVKRRYLTGKQLDSTMNYPFRDAVIGYAMGMSGFEFRNRILGIIENYPKPAIDALMNFVSTHDVERAINILGGESCNGKSKDWQAEAKLDDYRYKLGKKRLKIAMVLQFFLPGVPSIYYGGEAGMQGWKDPFNRGCYPWGSEDVELISFVRSLARIRRRCDLFREAGIKFLFWEGDVLGFARIDKEKCRAVVIIINRGENTEYCQARTDYFSAFNEYEVVRGTIEGSNIVIPPWDYVVVKIGKDIPTSEF